MATNPTHCKANGNGVNSARRMGCWLVERMGNFEKHRIGVGAQQRWEDIARQQDAVRLRRLYKLICKVADVVDFGCGFVGQPWCEPEYFDTGRGGKLRSWVGIEAPERLVNARVRSASITKTGLPAESYDCIILSRILPRVPSDVNNRFSQAVLLEAHRVLRLDGVVIGCQQLKSVGRFPEPEQDVSAAIEADIRQQRKDLKKQLVTGGFHHCTWEHTWNSRRNDDLYFSARKEL